VFLNGSWIGITQQPGMMTETLRNVRRTTTQHVEMSIVWDIQEQVFFSILFIYCTKRRGVRKSEL